MAIGNRTCLDQGFFAVNRGSSKPFLEAEFELISGTVTDLKELVDHVKGEIWINASTYEQI